MGYVSFTEGNLFSGSNCYPFFVCLGMDRMTSWGCLLCGEGKVSGFKMYSIAFFF